MKKSVFLAFGILMLVFSNAQSNLTVNSQANVSVDAILQQHFQGEGVLMSGYPDPTSSFGLSPGKFNNQTTVTYPQIGTFNRNGFTSFPFETGIVMTTGNVSVAGGPNNSTSASQSVSSYYQANWLLNYTTGTSVTSAAVLEFDFVASADTFTFNYIFASEEYCEYVNHDNVNDVFAFRLTGVDPTTFLPTTKNVAVVPGSITASNPNGTPVSIGTINHGHHDAGTSGPGTSPSNSSYFICNYGNSNGIQYDGYTTALSAEATILACQTYHMELGISNVGDVLYDSGVFLEEGSFYSPRVTIDTAWQASVGGGDTIIQHCRELDLTFTLPYPARTGFTEIIINPINAPGNAVLGQDYSLTLSNGMTIDHNSPSFVYEADSTIKRVHVKILPDAQFDPNNPVKTVALEIQTQGCTGTGFMDAFPPYKDTIMVYLRANDSIRLRDTIFTRCEKLDSIRVEQVSGIGPFTYHWIDTIGIVDTHVVSDTANLVTACNITESRTYKVAASDQWGCMTDTATVRVNIVPRPDFTVTYTPDHGCVPLSVTLNTQFSPDTAKLLWRIANGTDYSYEDTLATIRPSLPSPGYYNVALYVESAPGCNDSLKYDNVIHVADYPHADFTFGPEEPGNGEEVFFFNNSTGDNITDYAWNFGDGHSSQVEEPSHTYHLTESDFMTVRLVVTNSDGCSDDTIQVIPVEDHFALFVPSGFTPNTDNKNEIFQPKVKDVTNYEFTIYARTGELIFHTNSPEMGWDGTVQGKPAPEGVYLWKIHYAKFGTPDKMNVKTGTVTLIR
ncbi:MAG: choice-of-anchor L domain-containing protein [Bacteroidales bacterium]|nr:choice-of-anchor L domain-containing protein [Bacteroidales bacterium]